MHKLFHKISNIFIVIVIAMLYNGCSDNNNDMLEKSQHTEIFDMYNQKRKHAQSSISMLHSKINLLHTRNQETMQTSQNIIDHLICISPKQIDSLYNVLCNTEYLRYKEFSDSLVQSFLIEHYSAESIADLYEFIQIYQESRGHNLNLIQQAVQNQPVLIKNCMINSAAIIDEIIQSNSPTRALPTNSYCLRQLEIELAGSLITSEIQDEIIATLEVFPTADIFTSLFFAGYDLASALELAHKYNMCVATHIS